MLVPAERFDATRFLENGMLDDFDYLVRERAHTFRRTEKSHGAKYAN